MCGRGLQGTGQAEPTALGQVQWGWQAVLRLPTGNFRANWKLLAGGDVMARKGDQGTTVRRKLPGFLAEGFWLSS